MYTMKYDQERDKEDLEAAEEIRRYLRMKSQDRKHRRKHLRNSRKSWRKFRAKNECDWGNI
jgi:hypothetical protein